MLLFTYSIRGIELLKKDELLNLDPLMTKASELGRPPCPVPRRLRGVA